METNLVDGQDDPRPLLTIAASRDAEDLARRRAIAERCELVEAALEAIGFDRGCIAWRVALLVARVAGWQTLSRDLLSIAQDRDVGLEYSTPKAMREATRRAIRELADEGLIVVEKTQGEARRRARPAVTHHVTFVRGAVIDLGCQRSGQRSGQQSGQRSGQQSGQRSGQQSGQRGADHSLLVTPIPKTPKIPHPLGKSAEVEMKDSGGGAPTAQLAYAEVAPVAYRIFRALRYQGLDGETLWRVAAAHVCGHVSEDAIAVACRRARERGDDPVALFRFEVAKRSGLSLDALRGVLGRLSITGGWPMGPPRRPPPSVPAPVIRQPPVDSRDSVIDRWQRQQRALASIQDGATA